MENIEEIFDKFNDEFLKFDRVENKLSDRPDLHAFILLDKLVPSTFDIVSAASHDEIWLGVELEDLSKAGISEDQVRDLVRCGVRVDGGDLCIFA